MVPLPDQYKWIDQEGAPRILIEMRKLYGIKEVPGAGDNPVILNFAKEVGVQEDYKHDETAWCGLTVAVAVHRSGYDIVQDPLWALNWAKFGTEVQVAMLGDLLIKKRFNAQGRLIGGHVTLYIGEDNAGYYHCLGGNQSDAVSFARINRNLFSYIRRCPWKIAQPTQVRRIILSASGNISTKES